MKQATCLIVLLAGLSLTACGGGSSSSSTPTATTYTVGGTLSGLTASSGVVLEDNGGNSLTVSANGSFTFTQAVASGGTYAVTVETPPTGETCSVTGGTGNATTNITSVAVSCSSVFANGTNVAAVSVGTFPTDVTAAGDVFNVPEVTITVCDATPTCAPMTVMVDTGSSGLRLMSSSLTAAGLVNLTQETSIAPNVYYECAYYADGYAWGGVYTASKVEITNANNAVLESASNVPVQVIDTSATSAAIPSACSGGTTGPDLNSPDDFGADGILGVGVAAQDCGAACESTGLYYYSCPTTGCTSTSPVTTVASTAQEVTNPVTLFATDNNGVVLQLPTIAAGGAVSASGYLAFGVGTESDNGLGNATVLTITPAAGNAAPAYISTSFNSSPADGLIDSGSNALFFNDSSLAACGTSAPENEFYCPSATTALTATNTGANGNTSTVDFSIADLNTLSTSNFALDDVGGPAPAIGSATYFDWGLPFFYGRTVFTIIEGATVSGTTYANGAFAY